MITFGSFGPEGMAASLMPEAPKTGVMQFAFVDMGQGDCIMISCPDNKVFVVDCGSSGGLEDKPFAAAKALVRDWANGKSICMVMTHPDKDHYNKFIDLLVSTPKVPVSAIYFSRAKSDTSPLGAYRQTALGKNLSHFSNPMLIEVTLNQTTHSEKKWTQFLGDYQDAIGPVDVPETGRELAKGTTPGTNIHWSVHIIAGNVPATSRSAADMTNAASLCTLIKYGDQSMLLTGDSNEDTLKYLYDKQAGQIKNVTILQVPHHGSLTGIPTANFKNLVNPVSLIVSVGLLNDSFNLPRFAVIDDWKTGKRLRDLSRVVDFWKSPGEVSGYTRHSDLDGILKKWAKYPTDNNWSRTFFWLKDPNDATKAGTDFYGFTNNGFFLFRQKWNKDIWMTGIEGSTDGEFNPSLGAAQPPPPLPGKEKRL